MADDLDATVAGILAERAALAKEIHGMELILADARGSLELKDRVLETHTGRVHRDGLCAAAVVALNALRDDGYPALPTVSLQNSLLAEMKEQNDDLDAAVAVFSQQPAIAIGTTPTITTQAPPPNTGP